MRFLRNMIEHDDRTEERSRAVEKPEDCVEVVGGGEGEAADEEAGPNVVAEPPSYTNQAVRLTLMGQRPRSHVLMITAVLRGANAPMY